MGVAGTHLQKPILRHDILQIKPVGRGELYLSQIFCLRRRLTVLAEIGPLDMPGIFTFRATETAR